MIEEKIEYFQSLCLRWFPCDINGNRTRWRNSSPQQNAKINLSKSMRKKKGIEVGNLCLNVCPLMICKNSDLCTSQKTTPFLHFRDSLNLLIGQLGCAKLMQNRTHWRDGLGRHHTVNLFFPKTRNFTLCLCGRIVIHCIMPPLTVPLPSTDFTVIRFLPRGGREREREEKERGVCGRDFLWDLLSLLPLEGERGWWGEYKLEPKRREEVWAGEILRHLSVRREY